MIHGEKDLQSQTLNILSSYRLVHHAVVPGNIALQMRRRYSNIKIVRMTALSVVIFVLSWSPYRLVSLFAVCAGKHVITSGEVKIPSCWPKRLSSTTLLCIPSRIEDFEQCCFVSYK